MLWNLVLPFNSVDKPLVRNNLTTDARHSTFMCHFVVLYFVLWNRQILAKLIIKDV